LISFRLVSNSFSKSAIRSVSVAIDSFLSRSVSLALACAVKGGEEIAIIGHTDCQVARTTTVVLLEKLQALGVDRSRLPDNLNEFFGTFGSERQNVVKAVDFARNSPLIGPKIPVHGLLIDVATGKLDWVVNGYETLNATPPPARTDFSTLGALDTFQNFEMGEMKFPDLKIGDAAVKPPASAPLSAPASAPVPAEDLETVVTKVGEFAEKNWPKPPSTLPPLKKKSPPPPPIQPRPRFPSR
jgi:carbonic anhydrase